jgi:hypothetical protein
MAANGADIAGNAAAVAAADPRPRASRTNEADFPSSLVARFGPDKPLKLDSGQQLTDFQIGYQTYGTLNSQRTNAVLVCHALTGDQHVASLNPVTGKSGRAGRSTRTAISSSARTCSAAAWGRPARRRSTRRPTGSGASTCR